MVSYSDYLPFGQIMPNRHGDDNQYRYGFNGMESDDEIKDHHGTSYDFGARMYDPRVARFLSRDPKEKEYPWQSTYVFAADNPIQLIDLNGEGPDDPKGGTKVEKGAGGMELVLPENAKVLGRFIDKDKNGKINYGKKDLDAKAGDVDRFEADGVNYRANFKEYGSFNGYWDAKGNKYQPPNPVNENKQIKKIVDGTANVVSHPLTSVGLNLGDDLLRAAGLAKAIPGINVAANLGGAYVYGNDMANPNLSAERKAYKTFSNGVPLAMSTASMMAPYLGYSASFATGLGEASVVIGVVGYGVELLYDEAIEPSLQYIAKKSVEFQNWFSDGGYRTMYSDENLKTEIEPLDSSLFKLLKIKGYSFNWKNNDFELDGGDIGLIAQEIESIYPELVVLDSLGFKRVYYHKLIPILIEAMKEQQNIIDKQNETLINYKKEIDINERLINEVLNRLEKLENDKGN